MMQERFILLKENKMFLGNLSLWCVNALWLEKKKLDVAVSWAFHGSSWI